MKVAEQWKLKIIPFMKRMKTRIFRTQEIKDFNNLENINTRKATVRIQKLRPSEECCFLQVSPPVQMSALFPMCPGDGRKLGTWTVYRDTNQWPSGESINFPNHWSSNTWGQKSLWVHKDRKILQCTVYQTQLPFFSLFCGC